MTRIRFPDGTLIQASPLAGRREDDSWRDFGLYLDHSWKPAWPATMIDWPDFGLPVSNDDAFRHILTTFRRATAGENLEIGCLGGLGRTGTVLACFAVFCCDFEPGAAIEWVRSNYDRRAVETRDQEQWVHWFTARMRRMGTNIE